MSKTLRLLIVEDVENDAALIIRQLEKAGYAVESRRVEDADEMKTALQASRWDGVISDYRLPRFDAFVSLSVLKELEPDLPFIVVSGTIGEETAVKLMKAGAHDYVMKANLTRLVPAIERELREAEIRRKRRAAEEALQESEERFRNISSLISDIAYSCKTGEDGGYSIDWMMGAVESVTGYTLNEIRSRRCWRFLVVDEDMPLFEKHVAGLPSGKSGSCILRLRHKNGGLVWVESFAKCVAIRDQRHFYLFGGLVNITGRKRIEEALKKERNLVKSLLDNIPDHIYFKDADSRFIAINRQLAERFGLSDPDQAAGKTDFDFFTDEHARQAFEAEQTIVRTGRPIVNAEEKETWPDHPETWVSTTKMPLRDENGNVIGTFGISRDITERKKMEDQIRNDLKEKETLLKEIHHRVKNNMQIVISLLNLQSSGLRDPGILSLFKESQNRIFSMALVHEMLYGSENLSKIDFGRYVSRLIGNIEEVYKTDRFKIAVELDANEVELGIDEAVPCGLIVQEIVSNSFKHAFPAGWEGEPKIRIRLKRTGDRIELALGDNGIGMPAGLDLGTSPSLGLTLIHLLSRDQLGGEVNLDRSEAGTFFRIRFKTE